VDKPVEKVKLPKDVAETIEIIRKANKHPIRSTMDFIYCEGEDWDFHEPSITLKKYCEMDRSQRIENIVVALVNGYEIEPSPEEKVKAYYDEQSNVFSKDQLRQDNTPYAIRKVLNLLGIEIEGVNT
jgi:hypothetical protein